MWSIEDDLWYTFYFPYAILCPCLISLWVLRSQGSCMQKLHKCSVNWTKQPSPGISDKLPSICWTCSIVETVPIRTVVEMAVLMSAWLFFPYCTQDHTSQTRGCGTSSSSWSVTGSVLWSCRVIVGAGPSTLSSAVWETGDYNFQVAEPPPAYSTNFTELSPQQPTKTHTMNYKPCCVQPLWFSSCYHSLAQSSLINTTRKEHIHIYTSTINGEKIENWEINDPDLLKESDWSCDKNLDSVIPTPLFSFSLLQSCPDQMDFFGVSLPKLDSFVPRFCTSYSFCLKGNPVLL